MGEARRTGGRMRRSAQGPYKTVIQLMADRMTEFARCLHLLAERRCRRVTIERSIRPTIELSVQLEAVDGGLAGRSEVIAECELSIRLSLRRRQCCSLVRACPLLRFRIRTMRARSHRNFHSLRQTCAIDWSGSSPYHQSIQCLDLLPIAGLVEVVSCT